MPECRRHAVFQPNIIYSALKGQDDFVKMYSEGEFYAARARFLWKMPVQTGAKFAPDSGKCILKKSAKNGLDLLIDHRSHPGPGGLLFIVQREIGFSIYVLNIDGNLTYF